MGSRSGPRRCSSTCSCRRLRRCTPPASTSARGDPSGGGPGSRRMGLRVVYWPSAWRSTSQRPGYRSSASSGLALTRASNGGVAFTPATAYHFDTSEGTGKCLPKAPFQGIVHCGWHADSLADSLQSIFFQTRVCIPLMQFRNSFGSRLR